MGHAALAAVLGLVEASDRGAVKDQIYEREGRPGGGAVVHGARRGTKGGAGVVPAGSPVRHPAVRASKVYHAAEPALGGGGQSWRGRLAQQPVALDGRADLRRTRRGRGPQ